MADRLLFPIVMGLMFLLPPQAPPPAVGFVLSQDGPWELNGRAVKQGEGVPRGGRLLLAPGTTFDGHRAYSIDVVLLNNKALSIQCGSVEACRQGLPLPDSLTVDTPLATRLYNVAQLIFAKPERYVGLMSRDAAAEPSSFTDGVAKLSDGRVELAPFFQSLATGRYRLRSHPITSSSPPPDVNLDLNWAGTPESAAVNGLAAGVYRITLTRPSDPSFSEREAWILVAPGAGFDLAKTAFDDGVAATRSWPANVPPRDVQIFRHALLVQLATATQ